MKSPKSRPALAALSFIAMFATLASVAVSVEGRPIAGTDLLIITAALTIGCGLMKVFGAFKKDAE